MTELARSPCTVEVLHAAASVVSALGRLPPQRGAAAMQAINGAVLNRAFGGVFGGTAATCAGLVVAIVGAPGQVIGAGLILVGTFGVTVVVNVPNGPERAADWSVPRPLDGLEPGPGAAATAGPWCSW